MKTMTLGLPDEAKLTTVTVILTVDGMTAVTFAGLPTEKDNNIYQCVKKDDQYVFVEVKE